MSALAHAPTNFSPSYLSSLQSLVQDQQEEMDWLVITHDDPQVVRRMSNAIEGKEAVMIQVPQSRWDLSNGDLANTISWSIAQGKIRHLLLAGYSAAAESSEDAAEHVGGDSSRTGASAYGRLVAGAKKMRHQIQQSKNDFVWRVGRLESIPEVREAIDSGQLELHLLFYVEESGTFLTFDRSSGEFLPIVS
jgi:hypothetical protein